MQTFLPYADFEQTAKCLDWRRCGKQRVEAMQVLKAIDGTGGWAKHPACAMWRGYEDALKLYANVVIREWIGRGYNNNMSLYDVPSDIILPPWLGNEDFHSTHRARLLFKDQEHYGQFGWTETPCDQGYLWPAVVDGKIIWTDQRKGATPART
jgi:hypothetical protein